tara:strand:- start:48 stop:1814 length:1767 start_codon:yes stop_codon:yes gene_type:complete
MTYYNYDLEKEEPFYQRQKLEEDGDYLIDPQAEVKGPHYASIGTEMAIGITADFATGWMLGTGIGTAIYYPLNFGIGYSANALAQWMRGDEFDSGEAYAAGGFQTIPMGTTAKGLKGLSRSAAKSSVGSVAMAQLEVGIDEKRRLTAKEVILSGILGGATGGATHGVADVIREGSEQLNRLTYGLGGTSVRDTGGSGRKRTGKQRIVDPPDPNEPIFKGRFNRVEELDRAIAALIQSRTGPKTNPDKAFRIFAKEATEDLKKSYRALSSGELNNHHSNVIKSGVSLHEGRDEVESMIIESWLANKAIASGDDPLNNHLIPVQVHGLIHQWLNKELGSKYLTEILGPLNSAKRRRWENLPIEHPEVRRLVELYAEKLHGATNRTAELMQAYYKIWGPESKITTLKLSEITKRLGITELEYDQLVKPGLSRKDSLAYAKGYGPKKVKITWKDGTTETVQQRLAEEFQNDSRLQAQIDQLNARQVKIGDFSNELTSPTPAQIRRQGWAKEIEVLEELKSFRKLSRVEKKRLKELRELFSYGEGLPLLRGLVYGRGPFRNTEGITEQFNPRNPKIKKAVKKKKNNDQGTLNL